MRSWRLVVALWVCACALGEQPQPVLHGTWTATAAPARILRGTWTGHALPGRPDEAQGSWTLLSAGGIALAGTWAAEKTRRGWDGSWTARTPDGRALSGAWGAEIEGWNGKTLQDMLERTLQKEISGWWQSGHEQGNWWLKGSPPEQAPSNTRPQRTPSP